MMIGEDSEAAAGLYTRRQALREAGETPPGEVERAIAIPEGQSLDAREGGRAAVRRR